MVPDLTPPPKTKPKVGDIYVHIRSGMEAKISGETEGYYFVHYRGCVPFPVSKEEFQDKFSLLLDGKAPVSFQDSKEDFRKTSTRDSIRIQV